MVNQRISLTDAAQQQRREKKQSTAHAPGPSCSSSVLDSAPLCSPVTLYRVRQFGLKSVAIYTFLTPIETNEVKTAKVGQLALTLSAYISVSQ